MRIYSKIHILILVVIATTICSCHLNAETSVAGSIHGQTISINPSSPKNPRSKKDIVEEVLHKAIQIVIKNETKQRNIEITFQEITRQAKRIADKRLKRLGDTQVERSKRYAKVHTLTENISKAISIWKRNADAGNAYARKHLKPLGVSSSRWQWFKEHHDDPSVMRSLQQGQTYGDENIMQESRKMAKRSLRRNALVSQITSDMNMPNETSNRFALLLTNANKIQLSLRVTTVYQGGLLSVPERRWGISDETAVKERIIGPWKHNQPLPAWMVRYMAQAALSLESFKRNAQSKPILFLEGAQLVAHQYRIKHFPNTSSRQFDVKPERMKILRSAWKQKVFGKWLLTTLRKNLKIKKAYQWIVQ